jgi:hypothetical protein
MNMNEQQTEHICCNCDRAYDEPPKRAFMMDTTTMAMLDMGYGPRYNWCCGECTEGGKHWLASRVYGVAHRDIYTGEITATRSSHEWTGDTRSALVDRMQHWLDKADDADYVNTYSLFDLRPPTQSHHEGWFFPFMDENGKPAPPVQPQWYLNDILPAVGAEKFMNWFATHFTHRRRTDWSSIHPRWAVQFTKPGNIDYTLKVYNWRGGDDGIGGYNSPILFTITKTHGSHDSPGEMVVLCQQEVWMGYGDDTDIKESFDADDLFLTMFGKLNMRLDHGWGEEYY